MFYKVFVGIFLLRFVHVLYGAVHSDGPLSASECGALFNENGNNSTQMRFSLRDQDQSNNLVEDTRAGDSGWNVTTSAVVSNGCKMKTCTGTDFNGACQYLKPGTHNINQTYSSSIASVFCDCVKKCKCSDVHIKKSSCGRAYLKKSCNTCHTQYTDLTITSTKKDFVEKFSKTVKALKIRPGCELTIYPNADLEEDEEGENEEKEIVISQEITENFGSEIGSYKCVCNDELYVPRPQPPRPATYPPLLDIPVNMNQLLEMLRTSEFKQHPGLIAALRSYRNNRSPNNFYMLLIGSTGAGKSSTINLLFDRPGLTKVGGSKSTTSSIHEFRVPVAIDELGISNSELRIIDTPGMGDTRGLEQDARYLATLENYLKNHEELKNRIPNVVLIFHKFDDNRFDGQGAKFVQMVRGLDTFRQQITDENFSNVIFVFSHYMSVTKEEQRKPDIRIKKFKQVIEDFSLFPKPTHIVVAENKGLEQDLPMSNGFFQLPNYEYYPRNLFEKMDLITGKGGDPIGQGIIRTAFRDSENFNISRIDYPLMSSDSTQVQHYLGVLNNANFNVKDTNISRQLQHAWDNQLDQKLKKQYPYSLAYLQKALNLRNINNLEDVPRTTSGLLELVTALKHDAATRALLEQGLGVIAPLFPQNPIVGHGYHIFQDRPLTTSPLQLGHVQHSDIGFRIPSSISCNVDPGTKEQMEIFQDTADYINYRFKSLGVSGNSSVDKFKGVVQPGCNIRALSFRQDGCNVSATKDFRLFELELNDQKLLHPDFEKAVRELSPVNRSDHENLKLWEDFFEMYGTHVVKSAYGGGSIQVRLQRDQPFSASFAEDIFNLIKLAEDLTYDLENTREDNASTNLKIASSQVFTFIGGDPNFHTTDLEKMSKTDASNLLANWKRSLRLNPAILHSEMKLVPICLLVKGLGNNFTVEIEKATVLLFESNLKYIPPQKKKDSGPGLSRDDTPLVQDMMKAMQDQTNQMNSLLVEIKKIEQENERKRLELQEKQLNFTLLQKQLDTNATIELSAMKFKAESDLQEMRLKHTKELQKWQLEAESERREHEKKMEEKRQKHELEVIKNSGCLKADTLILMANGKEKRVDQLKIGDMIFDMELRPTKVLGVAGEFLLGNRFYGFSQNGPFFFTSNHLFMGQVNRSGNDLQLFAKSTSDLILNNPLMAYLDIKEFENRTNLLRIQNTSSSLKLGVEMGLSVYEDLSEHSENTLMYDIQVDSPSGTYFANGYVCRHEVPPVEYWSNTMSLLFRILETSTFVTHLPKLPYTINNVHQLHAVVDDLVEKFTNYLNSKQWLIELATEEDDAEEQTLSPLEHANVAELISGLFKSPTVSTVALRLYSRLGPVLAEWLDRENEFVTNQVENVIMQQRLFKLITKELEERFM